MNKKSVLAMGFAVATLISGPAWGRDGNTVGRDFGVPTLTPVSWDGTFRCTERTHGPEHAPDHRCNLEFVKQDGETWKVRANPALAKIHSQHDGPVYATIAAQSSPRYLMGSFVEVQQITTIPGRPVAEEGPAMTDDAPRFESSFMRR